MYMVSWWAGPFDSTTVVVRRLYQVEYARQAISHASTAIGILAQNGIVLAGRTSAGEVDPRA